MYTERNLEQRGPTPAYASPLTWIEPFDWNWNNLHTDSLSVQARSITTRAAIQMQEHIEKDGETGDWELQEHTERKESGGFSLKRDLVAEMDVAYTVIFTLDWRARWKLGLPENRAGHGIGTCRLFVRLETRMELNSCMLIEALLFYLTVVFCNVFDKGLSGQPYRLKDA